jgi:predicted acetyltransferase
VSHSSPSSKSPDTSDQAGATEVVLEPIAKDQSSVLSNLIELYVHDFSEHVPLEIKPNGRFDLPLDERWWTAEDHYPLFVRLNGKLAGFALARRGSKLTGATDVMDVAEFFVLRGLRRKGVGAAAARALFERFPGKWEIRIRKTNPAALKFWTRVVESWTGGPVSSQPFSLSGVDWDMLRIEPAG